jgi:hypothetical protein
MGVAVVRFELVGCLHLLGGCFDDSMTSWLLAVCGIIPYQRIHPLSLGACVTLARLYPKSTDYATFCLLESGAKMAQNIPMAYQEIKEKIKVMAVFKNGTIFPYVLDWGRERYKIDKVNLTYQEREGVSINYFFAIEAKGLVAKIKYNNVSFIWIIEEIWQE